MRGKRAAIHLLFLDIPQKWHNRNRERPRTFCAGAAQQKGAGKLMPYLSDICNACVRSLFDVDGVGAA
jgi:hypothetical protein